MRTNRTSIAALCALAGLMGHNTLSAQSFKEGGHVVSVGHGAVTFLGNLNRSFDDHVDLRYRSLGPVYLKYEYAMTDRIGLGVNLAYATNEWTYRYSVTDEEGNTRQHRETTTRDTYSVLARFN